MTEADDGPSAMRSHMKLDAPAGTMASTFQFTWRTDTHAAVPVWVPKATARPPPSVNMDGGSAGRGDVDGVRIRGYKDFKLIGQGASSLVFSAVQEAFDRSVAVKILSLDAHD